MLKGSREVGRDMRELGRDVFWNCIVITSSATKWRCHIEREMKKLSMSGLLPPHDLLLVIDDPQPLSVNTCKEPRGGFGVGSGGATLNALLVVAEKLSALNGYTTINSDVLFQNLILMVHFGRSSYHYPGGNAFLPLDHETSWLPPSIQSPIHPFVIQNSIWMASVLAFKSSFGVWVTSLDFLVPFTKHLSIPSTESLGGALLCSIKVESLVDQDTGQHGLLYSDSCGRLLRASYESIAASKGRSNDEIIISGTTFFSSSVAESVLALYMLPPLDRCTYYGTDSSCEPIQISLYFDLLLPLFSETDRDKYLSGELSLSYAEKAKFSTLKAEEEVRARSNIWNQLRKYGACEHTLAASPCFYLNPLLPFESLKEMMNRFKSSPYNGCLLSVRQEHSNKITSINSLYDLLSGVMMAPDNKRELIPNISSHITLFNCFLDEKVCLEADAECVLCDLRLLGTSLKLQLGKRIVWQCWPLDLQSNANDLSSVIACHGFDDHLGIERGSEKFTIFNLSWAEFSSRMNLNPEDIWFDKERQNLINARLFPSDWPLEEQLKIMSIVINLNNYNATVSCTTELTKLHGAAHSFNTKKYSIQDSACDVDYYIKDTIHKWKMCHRKSFRDIVNEVDVGRLLREREDTLVEIVHRVVMKTSHWLKGPSFIPIFKYIVAASPERCLSVLSSFHEALRSPSPTSSRLLANVADLLGCLGGPQGGLRSGPAANTKWVPALEALKKDYSVGIEKLESVCREFIRSGRPDDIIRASRHYERAAHIMISKQVETTREEVFPLSSESMYPEPLGKDQWVEGSCPARLDLAGGWTDTPPICYELGGCVLNVAVKVNGNQPIGAKARITDTHNIVFISKDISGTELRLVWDDLSDLMDYDNPVSSGALGKACLIYSGFVRSTDESLPLVQQLKDRYNGGLELVVWSELAQGSGLGGSSLLAGCILGVIFVLMGFEPVTPHKLIHATLGIEQMLTTGGGWQDQVGGLMGGIKLGVSRRSIPLVVETFNIPFSNDFLRFLNDRLFLVYTGKVRLARNLLQTVLRNWYSQDSNVTHCFDKLRTLALEAASCVLKEDGAGLGDCVNKYWTLKKGVASGCEPARVGEIMDLNRSKVAGQSLAGAGGGGYMFGMTREPCPDVDDLLHVQFSEMAASTVEIDLDGLKISVDGKEVMVAGCHGQRLNQHILDELID